MKTGLFVANIISASLLIVLAVSNPSITGLAVTPTEATTTLASPLGFATLFIIATIAFDVYFYMKSKKK